MTEQKPIRTFTLCDEAGNKYEVNEFKQITYLNGAGLENEELITTQYKTTNGEDVDCENNNYSLQPSGIILSECLN